MNKIIGIGAAVGLVALGFTAPAEAASFLSIQVGATSISCNNSTAAGVTACGAAGFDTTLNASTIQFTGGVAGVTFGNAATNTVGVQLVGNQPGTAAVAFATDTKTTVTNGTGGALQVTVSFASSGFSLPSGSPLNLSSTQSFQAVVSSGAMTQSFTGYGDQNNGLVPAVGTAAATPNCNVAVSPPTNSCSSNSPTVPFANAGLFALSGVQSFNLLAGATINSQGAVNVFGPSTVPEPASLALLGAGLLAAARRLRRRA